MTNSGAAFATETPSTADSLTASPNQAGNWFIVVRYSDPGTPVTSLEPYTLDFLTDTSNTCVSYCDDKPNSLMTLPGTTN